MKQLLMIIGVIFLCLSILLIVKHRKGIIRTRNFSMLASLCNIKIMLEEKPENNILLCIFIEGVEKERLLRKIEKYKTIKNHYCWFSNNEERLEVINLLIAELRKKVQY